LDNSEEMPPNRTWYPVAKQFSELRMIIRREQSSVFSNAASKSFEDRVFAHVSKCFPGECSALGDDGTRETIQYGKERASAYGANGEREIVKYIDLMFAFGRDFDRDPALSWASAVLNGRWKDAAVKLARLFEAGKEQYRQPGN